MCGTSTLGCCFQRLTDMVRRESNRHSTGSEDLMRQRTLWLTPQYAFMLCSLAASACGHGGASQSPPPPAGKSKVAPVDDARLRQAATDEGNWLTHGRT